MTKVIVSDFKLDCEDLVGQFVDENHYDVLIEEDCDFYAPPGCDIGTQSSCEKDCNTCDKGTDESKIIFKFRKNYFTQEEQDTAYAGLREAAVETQNRGMAAGPKAGSLGNREWVTEYQFEIMDQFLNPAENLFGEDPIQSIMDKYGDNRNSQPSARGQVWSINRTKDEGFEFDAWVEDVRAMSSEDAKKETQRVMKQLVCQTTYANSVFSGIAGYFDRYPRIPYGRPTAFTESNPDKFKMAFPFLQHLAEGFKKLLPYRYSRQIAACEKLDPKFVIPGTPFTTVTVNKTFRTAAHRDAGDLSEGFSNLTVVSNNGKYSGGYLVFPEFRVAVNIRPGDLLLVNNHEGIHGNTEMIAEEGAERISFVCYFREKMLELGSWDYEMSRKRFVEKRKNNKEHPEWRPLWNGVGAGMWESQEWYDYLESELGHDVLIKYHPESEKGVSLEGFF